MNEEKGLLDCINSFLQKLNDIKLFKKIAIWNNQVKYEKNGEGYSFLTPACFVEFKQNNSINLGAGFNLCEYDIILHLIDTQLNNNNKLDQNIKIFDIRNKVKHTFNNYTPSRMGKVLFVSDLQDFDHDNLYHFCLTYKGALLDNYGNNLPIAGSVSSVNINLGYTQSFNNQQPTTGGYTYSNTFVFTLL